MRLTESHILVRALSATQSPVTISDNRQPDNPLVYCNEAFLKLTGYKKEEVIGKNCRFLQRGDSNPKELSKLRAAMNANKDIHVILKNYTKKGKAFWNDLHVSPVFDDNGRPTHFIGLQIDITERIEQERAKAIAKKLAQEKELLALEKDRLLKLNEAKDDFISIASHQLRTPATVVKQYISMLSDGIFGELTESQKAALTKAYINNERQLEILDELLKIARIDAGKVVLDKQPTNMTDLLHKVVDEFEYRAKERSQSIRTHLGNSPVYLNIDKNLIRTVLENLLDNAIKYSHESGIVSISMENNEKMTKISFQDQGIGINQKDQERIFDKFMRSSSKEATDIGGTGLGLYWAKAVLDIHGASIDVVSEYGIGTKFELTFNHDSL